MKHWSCVKWHTKNIEQLQTKRESRYFIHILSDLILPLWLLLWDWCHFGSFAYMHSGSKMYLPWIFSGRGIMKHDWCYAACSFHFGNRAHHEVMSNIQLLQGGPMGGWGDFSLWNLIALSYYAHFCISDNMLVRLCNNETSIFIYESH